MIEIHKAMDNKVLQTALLTHVGKLSLAVVKNRINLKPLIADMKTLYLVRHGKSSWHYPELDDMARPLKSRGENDAHLMGKWLRKQDATVDVIISSPAKRAKETAKIFADELRYESKVLISDELYMKGIAAIVKLVNEMDNSLDSALVVSHNPDLLELANLLSGRKYDNVPTCGVLCVKFAVETWAELATNNGVIRFFDYPSKHK